MIHINQHLPGHISFIASSVDEYDLMERIVARTRTALGAGCKFNTIGSCGCPVCDPNRSIPTLETDSINDTHHRAMGFAAQGFMAQMGPSPPRAIPLFEQALELELAAIAALPAPIEPTFSVLHRSAGWMAIHCRQYRQAEQLACKALALNPPDDIATELRHLWLHANRGSDGDGLFVNQDFLTNAATGPMARTIRRGIPLVDPALGAELEAIAQWLNTFAECHLPGGLLSGLYDPHIDPFSQGNEADVLYPVEVVYIDPQTEQPR